MNFQALGSWFLSHGTKIIIIIVVAFLVNRVLKVFIGKIVKKIVGNINKEASKKRFQTLISVFEGTANFVVGIVALLMILPEFGIDIGALLAGAGLIGLAVSMGSREIIADFMSGLFIILENQYQVGDEVNIAGIEGKVKAISLRRTVIKDELGTIHLIPNSQIKIVAKKTQKKDSI